MKALLNIKTLTTKGLIILVIGMGWFSYEQASAIQKLEVAVNNYKVEIQTMKHNRKVEVAQASIDKIKETYDAKNVVKTNVNTSIGAHIIRM